MKDEPGGKGAAQGEQDGAAGSQSGFYWALRGAEVAVFPFYPVFPRFPSFLLFSPSLSQLIVIATLSLPAVSGIAGGRRKKEHP